MGKPVVGIISNLFLIDDLYPAQISGNMYIEAIAEVAGAVPMIIPSLPDCANIDEIMGIVGQPQLSKPVNSICYRHAISTEVPASWEIAEIGR